MKELVDRIRTITEEAGGTWGIALEDLDLKESWACNGEESFYAASVIKVPILLTAFTAFDQDELSLSDSVVLKKEDVVGGSGVLQYMTPGTYFTVYDILTLMIIQSDNTATNIIIDLVGKDKIRKTMKTIGLDESEFYNKLMVVPANLEGVNQVTALDMTSMLKQMATGKVVSMDACEKMIDMMKKQQLQNCLPHRLPEQDTEVVGVLNDWELAHKTGSIQEVCHDIGIFYVGNRTMVVSILSRGLEDNKSPLVIADIGWEIYRYLKTS